MCAWCGREKSGLWLCNVLTHFMVAHEKKKKRNMPSSTATEDNTDPSNLLLLSTFLFGFFVLICHSISQHFPAQNVGIVTYRWSARAWSCCPLQGCSNILKLGATAHSLRQACWLAQPKDLLLTPFPLCQFDACCQVLPRRGWLNCFCHSHASSSFFSLSILIPGTRKWSCYLHV